jgi:hypothetical protein
MLLLVLYVCFNGFSCSYALHEWRKAWLLVIICGVVQDPVRKVAPGSSVVISFLVVFIYAAILFRARNELIAAARDFAKRFPNLYTSVFIFIVLLMVAAFNGLFTYGFDKWKVPLVSFITYVVPLAAMLLGYTWFTDEAMMYRFFRLYAAVTSVALIGTVLEYFRVGWRVVGMVSFEGDFIRYLPGIEIRLLSGFYRSPDIMAWHAATLTTIGILMALRAGFSKETAIWASVAGWGFLNCMIAGRRKAIYYIIVFCAAFMWRYIRRVNKAQIFAILGVAIILGTVLRNISSSEETNIYARGAVASRQEIAQRLEGGVMETFRQFGLMGAGLGTATQGVRHLLGTDVNIGWQEGGLGKLAIEIGLPGIIAIALIGWVVLDILMKLTRIGDVPGSSQFMRAALFALATSNATGFLASAQAYTDAVLALTAGFFVGALFATATLDERVAAAEEAAMAPAVAAPQPA